MGSLTSWLLAARPKTLPAAVAPVAAGTALGARLSGTFHPALAFWALASCLALQVATNLFNDAIDHQRGADTAARLGPRRVTASGDLTARQVFLGAFGFLLLAALCGLPLVLARGWPMLAVGIPSLYLCFGYTGGPLPLAYRGLGELFVLVFFGWVAVIGSCFLQTGRWHVEALLLGTQIGLLSTALIGINNLRDLEEDRLTDKRTLAVRLGSRWAKGTILVSLLAPAVLGLGWLRLDIPRAAWWPLAAFPLAAFLAARVAKLPPSRRYNRFLALSALHLLLMAALLTAALVS